MVLARGESTLLWALIGGGVVGVLDGGVGLVRARSLDTAAVVGLVVVLLLHSTFCPLVTLAMRGLVGDFRDGIRDFAATLWRASRDEEERARALRFVGTLAGASLGANAGLWLAVSQSADVATPAFVAIIHFVFLGVAACAGGWLGLRASRAAVLRGWTPRLSRRDVIVGAVGVGLVALILNWLVPGSVFGALRPWPFVALGLHVVVAGSALWGFPRVSPPTGVVVLLWFVVAAAGVAASASAGAVEMVRYDAPATAVFSREMAVLTDFDGDGAAWGFGGGDCAPFDERVYPGAVDAPGEDLDRNCDGLLSNGPAKKPRKDRPAAVPLGEVDLVALISVDTLRQDHMELFGYDKRPTTPQLTAWLKRGLVFENAFTPATVTLGAVPAMLTGRPYTELLSHMDKRRLDKKLPTLATVLKKRGFKTAAFTSGLKTKKHRWHRGFQQVDDVDANKRDNAREMTAKAVKWLESNEPGKRFLWVHYFDPHSPRINYEDLDYGWGDKARYDEGLFKMDPHVTRLLRAIEDAGNALVIFVADHGEGLGDLGQPLHGMDVYDPGARIPLVVWHPSIEPRRVETAASTLDVLPTVLHAAGVHGVAVYGDSLLPFGFGAPEDLERIVFTESYYGYEWVSASSARHRLIHALHAGQVALFAAEDHGARNDLFDAGDPTTIRMANALNGFMKYRARFREQVQRGRRIR
jgi:hypothetical protein